MKTTEKENTLLTQTMRGTPMGDLLRRYWWPVGISAHLKDKPTFIRVMGEDLVLFRDGQGRAGVLGAYCASPLPAPCSPIRVSTVYAPMSTTGPDHPQAPGEHGENASWTTLRRILQGQHRVTASFRRKDGRTLHVRKATRAEQHQLKIYTALDLDPAPVNPPGCFLTT